MMIIRGLDYALMLYCDGLLVSKDKLLMIYT